MQQVNSNQSMPQQFFCSQNRDAEILCCTSGCKTSCFICFQKNCKCYRQLHKSCSQFLRISKVIQKMNKKKGVVSKDLQKAMNTVIKIYDDAIQQLSKDRQDVYRWKQMYGLSKQQAVFFRLAVQGNFKQITGDLAHKIKSTVDIEPQTSSITEQKVDKFWKQRKMHFDNILKDIKQVYKANIVPLTSTITSDSDQIQRFLGKPVLDYKLLYRASQHNFSVAQFHHRCDGIEHTLLLVRTQFDKVIGGYTPISWKSQIGYASDPSGKSFVFSLTLNQKYPLLQTNKAIYCRNGYGPDFGQDICIRPQAHLNKDSYCKFPSHYNNGNYIKGQTSIQAFCGAQADQFIRIKQWEVFQIEWLSK